MNKPKFIKYPLFIIITAFALSDCKKSNPSDNTPATSVDVYVAANVQDSISGEVGSAIWKNGQLLNAVISTYNPTNGVAVLGTDIYTSGVYRSLPAYSKNLGAPITLPTGGYAYGYTSFIAVQGSNVYIAGGVLNDIVSSNSVYWKNGVLHMHPEGEVTGIAVSGNDVYMCGYSATQAVYWKNDGPPVADNNMSIALCIAVSGTDVYLGGRNANGEAVFSKNGKGTTVSSAGSVNFIATNGTDVFMAGQNYNIVNKVATNSNGTYWKNTDATLLFPKTIQSYAEGLCVNGADVYVAGQAINLGTTESSLGVYYWKNGTPVQLVRGNYKIIAITGIVAAPTQ